MEVYEKIIDFQKALEANISDKTIGFVPTMGALHEGHLSLIKQAKKENDLVVVSIFVNPTQFNNADDLKNYPKTLESDLNWLKADKCDFVLVPNVKEMYPNGEISESFSFDGLEQLMEGEFRPGHFNGVGTIVKRLLEIVNPTNAYFGEKDYQQLLIIKKLVKLLHLKVTIVSCPIFREVHGLAMSSRNELLTSSQRQEALLIFKTLIHIKSNFNKKPLNQLYDDVEIAFKLHPFFKLEYFVIADAETLLPVDKIIKTKSYRAFIAVFAGNVRLIDNLAL